MPVLPKSLYVLGAGFQTARTARRLKSVDTAVPAQHAAFKHLMSRFAATEIGRFSGIDAATSYERFRSRTPLRSYEQFAPYIARMKRGEAGILWPGQCSFYASTSGTSTGQPKSLPVTEEMLAHFRQTARASLLYYSARVGHSGVFRGRHLFLGGSGPVAPVPGVKPFVAYGGDISSIAALNLPPAFERHLYEPGADIVQIEDWEKKIAAIAARTRTLDITLLAGIPNWLLSLTHEVQKNSAGATRLPSLQHLWPNLECIVHGGIPLSPFREELRQLAGADVNFHEVYAATEGIIGAQDADAAAGLRLFADAGLFYEFLPAAEFDPALPAGLGGRTMPLEGVRIGEDYVLVLTSPAGLCRYVTGDIVRFISTKPARLIHVGRTASQLNAFNERVSEHDVTESLVAVCQRHNWTIKNFHVAPLAINSLTGQNRGRHEWWVELRAGTIETPTGPFLAGKLDAELLARNPSYSAKRKAAVLEAPVVRLVMPGFFEHWLRHHGKWGGFHKLARCSVDRVIADELSSIACFTED